MTLSKLANSSIIYSKKAAKCQRDMAGLEILEKTLNEKSSSKKLQLQALKRESERALIDQIRRRLALPIERRTHFLRVRCPGGGSHL